jgi:trehalose 6-phosphate phosphatase
MRHLFSPEGTAAVAAVVQRSPLLAFDFDGTLAPIVDHPDDAHVPEALAAVLGAAAERWPVAIVTGRDVSDVRGRLGFAPRWIIGNHGAEDPEVLVPPGAIAALRALRLRIAAAGERLAADGVEVETKRLSLALHYRRAPDAGVALFAIEELLQGLGPELHRFGGKCVVNVAAIGLPDKGEALTSLVRRSGAGAAFFVGDDINDEAVFRRATPPWLTLRIGRDAPDSSAMFGLDSQEELTLALQRLMVL